MTDQFPPAGYVKAHSAVDGIDVYMPAPPHLEVGQLVVEFNCPQCGAATAFSARDGGLKCSHCGYYEAPEKAEAVADEKTNEFTPEALAQSNRGWGEPRKELECLNCGAKTSLPVEMLTHTCAFCGSNQVIQRQASQDLLRPSCVIPFKIDTYECANIARRWLGSSWMTPAEVGKLAEMHAFTGVYLPFWAFDCATSAGWEAEVGHTRTERYFDPSIKDWKTRTVTDWNWESGQYRGSFENLLVKGTQRLSALLLKQVEVFQFGDVVPCEPKYLAGFEARAYDIPLETAWQEGRSLMREQTRQACREQASSSQIRNFKMSLDFGQEGWNYLLLPFYVAAYSYQHQIFQVIINGQTGAIAGQRPVDWKKVWLVIAALLFPGLLFGLVGLLTLPLGGLGVFVGGVGFLLLIIGIAIAVSIVIKAHKMDDA
jgi:predicted RNA-binding Zn-ribbon protein involved in translation (DUF1610 family)